MKALLGKVLKGFSKDKPIDYERAKELARHKDVSVRCELAKREDVTPEILYYLAEDKSPEVRKLIAGNTAAPSQVDLLLAVDEDHDVRVGLAEKIALLAPGLTADEQDAIRKRAYEVLQMLARDQVTRVRQILSETLKDVAHAPPEVIRQLAYDAELIVSGPILEFSPVLTVEDLIEIIAANPAKGSRVAISHRKGLGEAVSDAIAKSDDVEAVAVLLGNNSAQIREETLDNLIDRAIDIEQWHAPLAKRPRLPKGAASRLARFVADNLLEILMQRKDLDPETADQVRIVFDKRMAEEGIGEIEVPADTLKKAMKEMKKGRLKQNDVLTALDKGNRELAVAYLIALSEQTAEAVIKAISTKSAAGIVAISWKAGMPAETLEQLQTVLCGIPENDAICAENDNDYPLSEDEMKWQLDFLKDLAK